MSSTGKPPSLARTFLKDLLFIVPFFVVSFLALRGTVPSMDPFWVFFWAGMVALCMTGVAWLALQMFKVVLADQLAMNRSRGGKK
jgi:hypothetical protein